jgi:hypothetical protein
VLIFKTRDPTDHELVTNFSGLILKKTNPKPIIE